MVSNTSDCRATVGDKRLFSFEQANSSLPLVERIVQDILHVGRKVRDYQEQFESLQIQGNSTQSESTMADLAKAREKYRDFCRELSALGCRLGDEISGTVEFPAVVNGRGVVLSWRPGESEVTHWHDPGKNSSERRLLSELKG